MVEEELKNETTTQKGFRMESLLRKCPIVRSQRVLGIANRFFNQTGFHSWITTQLRYCNALITQTSALRVVIDDSSSSGLILPNTARIGHFGQLMKQKMEYRLNILVVGLLYAVSVFCDTLRLHSFPPLI